MRISGWITTKSGKWVRKAQHKQGAGANGRN